MTTDSKLTGKIRLDEAAHRLGCHVETLRIRVRDGRLVAVRGASTASARWTVPAHVYKGRNRKFMGADGCHPRGQGMGESRKSASRRTPGGARHQPAALPSRLRPPPSQTRHGL